MPQVNVTLSVVLIQEGDSWVAQALEYDIAAQGKSLKAASEALERTVVGQIAVDISGGLIPLEGIEQAPQTYWDHFYKAEPLKDNGKPLRVPVSSPTRVRLEDTRVYA